MERLDACIRRWVQRGEEFQRYRATVDGSTLCREFVAELEQLAGTDGQELVGLEEAARRSGYTADHIGRMVRNGKIPNLGRRGAPLLRMADVPRKAPSLTPASEMRTVATADRRRIARSVLSTSTNGGTTDET